MDVSPLHELEPGTRLVVGGDRVVTVDEQLSAAFEPGDAILPLTDGTILHVPAVDRRAARTAVDAASHAFEAMGQVDDDALDAFYRGFADRLEDDTTFQLIAQANEQDVASARERGRSTTRLALDDKMRHGMIEGLRGWADGRSPRGEVVQTLDHDGWRLEQVVDRLGVVAFVFEGRPNVFADACGVLRGGNTVVFRIGSDALGTARAIVTHALDPALADAGVPAGAAALVDAPSRAAGWALFSDRRLALAVARGSGEAVRQLSEVAQQAGNSVSAHGTGGAWMVATSHADTDRFAAVVHASLDRKVCNTLNTCAIARDRADELVPVFRAAVERTASDRGTTPKFHVLERDRDVLPSEDYTTSVAIHRAEGLIDEPQAETLIEAQLAVEWEWEGSPEVTLLLVDGLDEAIELFNRNSPRFTLSVISEDPAEHERAFADADAPFVGDGFTRWVDGQYALGTPELGLSNWQLGRLFGRSAILSGSSIHTIRSRATQSDPHLHR